MARVPFIAGNWKLNLGPTAAGALGAELASALRDRGDTTVAVFPTALSVPSVLDAMKGSGIGVGLQDVEVASAGAFTGANSAAMARQLGCEYFLAGHSERRQHYGDADGTVGRRLRAGLDAGLLPILCVGETLDQRQSGSVDDVVHRQLAVALKGFPTDTLSTLTVAYEPVWAIGTGETATPAQAQQVHASIRGWLTRRVGATLAEQIRILYGGSVKPANAAELLDCPDIDGALVGGASLNAASFTAIVAATQ